jgi:hypothetical protein
VIDWETLRSEFGPLYALGKLLILLSCFSRRTAQVILVRAAALNRLRP